MGDADDEPVALLRMPVLLSNLNGVDVGTLARKCPDCQAEIRYAHRGSWIRAVATGLRCRKCARRGAIDPSPRSKRCTNCGETKSIDKFVVNTKRRISGYTERCKDCENARFATVRADLARRVDALKVGQPCTDCGGLFPPVCLDFDHLPQFQKRLGISRMVSTCRSWAAITAEIAKCELVCANCHRIRTDIRGYAR